MNEEAFQAELEALPARVGERNRRLFTIVWKGRSAGLDAAEITRRIIDSSGSPPLAESEVRRAVEKVFAQPGRTAPAPLKYRPEKRRGNPRLKAVLHGLRAEQPKAPAGGSRGSAFVRRMISAGGGEASSAQLIESSFLKIARDPVDQAFDFCLTLNLPDTGYFFLGDPRQKRTRESLIEMDEMEARLVFDSDPVLPTHILPNDLTGKPALNEKGEPSYGLEACLKHRRYAVVEFDELPLKVQAAFWLGVIKEEMLPVVSLVYSGGKSIHGLLRVADGENFRDRWDFLAQLLASDADPAYRCDLACRNPGRMTRFPGAIRPETGRRQSLLYLK